jgi:hypothetical protein
MRLQKQLKLLLKTITVAKSGMRTALLIERSEINKWHKPCSTDRGTVPTRSLK